MKQRKSKIRELQERIEKATLIAEVSQFHDSKGHKAYCIDQIVQTLSPRRHKEYYSKMPYLWDRGDEPEGWKGRVEVMGMVSAINKKQERLSRSKPKNA